MTNQQGAPEALRLADRLSSNTGHVGGPTIDAAASELRRLHAENVRLAALVEAQQPAPSAAAASKAVLAAIRAANMQLVRTGDDEFMLVTFKQPAPSAAGTAFDEHGFRDWVRRNMPDDTIIGNSAWWADHLTSWAKRFVKAAPQPSPTPQADSQPAPVRDYPPLPRGWPARFRCDSCDGNGEVGEPISMGHFQPPERERCPDCDGRGWCSEEDAFSADHMRAYVDADRAASAPADSVLEDAALLRYACTEGGSNGLKWLAVYERWDGDGYFIDALRTAYKQDAARKQGGAT